MILISVLNNYSKGTQLGQDLMGVQMSTVRELITTKDIASAWSVGQMCRKKPALHS
jgi:hypothetical protein